MDARTALSRDGLECWTRTKLQVWLEERGQKKIGTKNALINRVLNYSEESIQ